MSVQNQLGVGGMHSSDRSAVFAVLVSDLHLTPSMPATLSAFLQFLEQVASHAQRLYLLGDVFEYWAGDDDLTDPFLAPIIAALRSLTERGVAVYWLAGNRDFLVGEAFAHATGITLLTEPHRLELGERALLLLHGDAQCTGDQAYMAFRQQVRDPLWQQSFLARPLAERKAIIHGMREGSRAAQREKSMAIMDVTPSEMEQLFHNHKVDTLIHGHTHRPAVHESPGGRRYVLPDWDCDTEAPRGGWLALHSDGSISRHSIAE